MTSRAEYRLLLRQDNADLRLTEIGHRVGLVTEERYNRFLTRKKNIENELERLKKLKVTNKKEVNEFLLSLNSAELRKPISLYELMKRPELDYFELAQLDTERPELPNDVGEQVNILTKYEGYIQRQFEQVAQFKKFEKKLLPKDINYRDIKGLRTEAKQKLNNIKPISVGQASRISGVSPADISVLLIYLEHHYNKQILIINGGLMNFYDLMSKSAEDVGLQLSKEQYEKFIIYMKLLQEWNEKINLTAIVEDEEIIKKHFIDSIKAFKRDELKNANTLIDVGQVQDFQDYQLLL